MYGYESILNAEWRSLARHARFPSRWAWPHATSDRRARHEAPVLASVGLRAAAVADLFASLARLLSPVLDVLIRLWLAEGFLVADVMQHMPSNQATVPDHLPPPASLFAGLAATGFGIFVQTIGRQAAVADFAGIRVRGAAAWWLWGAAHIAFLIGARNRITVLASWLWAYLTFQRGSRLITGSASTRAPF
jgi:hypothetical protein